MKAFGVPYLLKGQQSPPKMSIGCKQPACWRMLDRDLAL
jgi:hypothetical protein